ncbi:Hypothetical predicted protein, partial [Paramuricea clavata]
MEGQINSALRYLSEADCDGVLPLTDDVMRQLQEKHPEAQEANLGSLLFGPFEEVHDSLYQQIDGEMIRETALRTKGSGGPSGVDANGFKRIFACKSFKKSGVNLCEAVATMTRRLCTEYIDPRTIEPILASRLIPLDKGEGAVRPIGVGEVIRKIVGKCVMKVIKPDVIDASGSLQAMIKKNYDSRISAIRRVKPFVDKYIMLLFAHTLITVVKAARIILNMSNDVNHSIALRALGWEPLKTERKKANAKIMYKVLNKMGLKSLTNLFSYKCEKTNYNLRDISSGLSLPKPRTNNMKNSFINKIAAHKIDIDFVSTSSLETDLNSKTALNDRSRYSSNPSLLGGILLDNSVPIFEKGFPNDCFPNRSIINNSFWLISKEQVQQCLRFLQA